MNVDIQATFKLSLELKSLINKRFSHLEKLHPEISNASSKVFLKIEPLERVAEITIPVSGVVLFSKGKGDSFENAITESAQKISRQIEKKTDSYSPKGIQGIDA